VKREQLHYQTFRTAFGPVAIVWWTASGGPRVRQVLLARNGKSPKARLRRSYPGATPLSAPEVARLAGKIQRFLEGKPTTFDLGLVALEVCGDFQRRVLVAEYGIPRGRVSTYGRIASTLGVRGAARAVGNALAGNPFPIIIPCHRAVRGDGSLGGYQGGAKMKRALLVMEGLEFTPGGKVVMQQVHYSRGFRGGPQSR